MPVSTNDIARQQTQMTARPTQTAVATSGRYDEKASAANPDTPVSRSADDGAPHPMPFSPDSGA
jgi:hypothetical protein